MRQRNQWRTGVVAAALTVGLAAGVSAQYQGWTIPDTAKTEKSPVKAPADAAKKGKALYTTNCAKCHAYSQRAGGGAI